MSLWGNNDNVTSAGKITSIDYANKTVTGSGTAWGATGSAQVGDVLRIGVRGPGVAATYFGDAVITAIASATSCSIASTASLVNPNTNANFNLATAGITTAFTVSQMPIWCTQDLQGDRYRNQASAFESDSLVFGISNAVAQNSDSTAAQAPSAQKQFKTGSGWVGVTTYIDTHGNYRVKTETLVAMSGISTGGIGYYTEG
jgi:hypothetical protein|tara:strand:- start:641 stop:1243 length:603 start_codon:yes stop_codon:yes gene_type:complete